MSTPPAVSSRISGYDPTTGRTHIGRVIEHRDGLRVIVVDETTREKHEVDVVARMPRFGVGDRVRYSAASEAVGTVTRSSADSVDIAFDDGSGYHGADEGPQHA